MTFQSRRMPSFVIGLLSATLLVSCGGGGDGASGRTASVWLIPVDEVIDGGPGVDGIPSIDVPLFEAISANTDSDPEGLVIGLKHNGRTKAYPHDIMTWHEIVNDDRNTANALVLSFCPLTGTAMAWQSHEDFGRTTFGTSGLLYNNNLILYDRATGSHWSQMLQMAVEGERIREELPRLQVVETKLSTWQTMYPDSEFMTRETSYSRDYDITPYGNAYTSNQILLFPISNDDNRLRRKIRVVGIRSDTASRVYQISGFGPTTQTINDDFEGTAIVVVGNSDLQFGVIYNRRLDDGSILNFTPRQGDLPNVMQDDEGNVWDILGLATSGPRAGAQLHMTRSYTAMWFAWATYFVDAEIYFN